MTGDGGQGKAAVVGMACRLPKAADLAAFWTLLRDGVDAVADMPPERWDAEPGFAGAPAYTRRGGWLEHVDRFDADFFGIPARQAATMDPRQRLLLELSWEALEDARVVPERCRGSRTGVFVGAMWDDYAALAQRYAAGARSPYEMSGLHRALLANRLSYLLRLRGPSLVVDTGQSSSLVAVHLAVESLLRGECDMALVGGVNLVLDPGSAAVSAAFGGLSPSGRSATFDADADGYARGEGGGVVVLKPLETALADGDRIYGVILGGAVNNDGGGDTLTTPDQEAQQDVVRRAHASAGIRADDVQHVELHGTGTFVGDPIEARALGTVFSRGDPTALRVGSVKTAIGHLEGAAGMAGLIKTILCISNRRLVPSLHFRTPNPRIPLDELGLRVQTETGPWPEPDRPLIAGVSSFGMGGTNCHLVVAEPPAPHAAPPDPDPGEDTVSRPIPWPLSGRNRQALRDQARRLLDRLREHPARTLDIGLSLATTRTAFEHRAVLLSTDRAGFERGLTALAAGQPAPGLVEGATGPRDGVAFVFPGQGSQWTGMAVPLLESSPVFREHMNACADAFAPYLDRPLLDTLDDPATLRHSDLVQPALFAVMVSLAALWESYGVRPSAVVGHSQGEVAAACVAGALTLPDAARIVALRSRLLMRLARRGGMLSIALAAEEVVKHLPGGLTVAAVNGPGSTVVSGDLDALTALQERYDADGVRARRVAIDYASHSHQVEVIRAEMLDALAPTRPAPGRVPFHSTVKGGPLAGEELTAEYWYRNLRHQVRFAEAVRTIDCGIFVEVSPNPVLTGAVRDTVPEAAVLGTLRRDEGGLDRFLTSLSEAYAAGAAVAWDRCFAGTDARAVDLPTYPFQRKRHWLDTSARVVEPPATKRDEPERVAEEAPPDPAELVRAQVAALLGHHDPGAVDMTATFTDLGLDSPLIVELSGRLAAATGLRLPVAVMFNHPTPALLAEHLRARLRPPDPLSTMLDRLAEALEEPPADPARRAELADRLAALSRQAAAPAGTPPEDGVAGRLRTASVDELLSFIDGELG
ncbi:type I polyketide synthase [Nonomuraea indica]|uniref:type I polyketide synthase n=1 Tax=Nonomuraea indica TaxID=1581193 RepID=UPI001182D379|nr:type I polyketide synthase [Nonomuraea indica]